jgi:hypothetical protein
MWLWDAELWELGFRRKSEDYWQCVGRYGLPDGSYLSVFSWAAHRVGGAKKGLAPYLVELTEFHVTIPLGGERLHFYYHQRGEEEWEPGGHTSGREVRRVGGRPRQLRRLADAVAAEVVRALGGVLKSR